MLKFALLTNQRRKSNGVVIGSKFAIFSINEITGSSLCNRTKISLFRFSYNVSKTLNSSVNNVPYDYTVLKKIRDLPCSKNRKLLISIRLKYLLLFS
jgi:hypothetical protein